MCPGPTKKKVPKKVKNEGKGAYKGHYEGKRLSKNFAMQANQKVPQVCECLNAALPRRVSLFKPSWDVLKRHFDNEITNFLNCLVFLIVEKNYNLIGLQIFSTLRKKLQQCINRMFLVLEKVKMYTSKAGSNEE